MLLWLVFSEFQELLSRMRDCVLTLGLLTLEAVLVISNTGKVALGDLTMLDHAFDEVVDR